MRYDFKNTETGEIVEKVFSMIDVPEEFTENGVLYVRNMASEYKDKSLQIPPHMRSEAVNKRIMGSNIKSPSGRKHYY